MHSDMVFQTAAALLSQILGIREDEIRPDTVLCGDPGVDPLDIARFIIACEKKFDIVVHDEDVHTFVFFKDSVRYIDEAFSEGGQSKSLSSDEERDAWYYQ